VAGASGTLWAALTFGVLVQFREVDLWWGGSGILITLLLEGSTNPFHKSARMRNHGTEPVADRDDLPVSGRISS
jgi:hypothetical protein